MESVFKILEINRNHKKNVTIYQIQGENSVIGPLDISIIRVYTRIMDKKFSCTCTTVRHTAQTLTEVYDQILAPSELKITQYMLLQSILSADTEKSITSLAQELDIDRSTTGRNLRVLEREGFVVWGRGNDRREHVVRATEKAQQAIAIAYPLWQTAQQTVVDTLGQEQLDTLRALLSQLEKTTV